MKVPPTTKQLQSTTPRSNNIQKEYFRLLWWMLKHGFFHKWVIYMASQKGSILPRRLQLSNGLRTKETSTSVP